MTGNPFGLENNRMVGAFLALHLYLSGRSSLGTVLKLTVGAIKNVEKRESCCHSICYKVAVKTKTGVIGKLIRMCTFLKKKKNELRISFT